MAGSYDKGDSVRCQGTFTLSGVDVDPTTVTVKLQDPSGNEEVFVYGTDPEIVRAAAGVYTIDVTLDEHGIWFYRWEATGNLIAAHEGNFYVADSEF